MNSFAEICWAAGAALILSGVGWYRVAGTSLRTLPALLAIALGGAVAAFPLGVLAGHDALPSLADAVAGISIGLFAALGIAAAIAVVCHRRLVAAGLHKSGDRKP